MADIQQQQQQQQPKMREFVKSLGEFFKRDLISIPLTKRHPHQLISQRCGLKAATLEFDTTAHPNIEYIAGNRLSIYPVNPIDHVQAIMKHLIDDVGQPPTVVATTTTTTTNIAHPTTTATGATGGLAKETAAVGASKETTNKRAKTTNQLGPSQQQQQQQQSQSQSQSQSHQVQQVVQQQQTLPLGTSSAGDPNWAKFVQLNGRDSMRLALIYLYDIMTAPSRDLLRLMAECCSSKDHKLKLLAISRTDDAWEKWICSHLRTLKSTLDEFSSCSISAKTLFSELNLQQPRQYSISAIKSSKRFRAEIMVFQHKFTPKQMALSLLNVKEHERMHQQYEGQHGNAIIRSPAAVAAAQRAPVTQPSPITAAVTINTQTTSPHYNSTGSKRSSGSVRSLRYVAPISPSSPITSQQVRRVPSYSGPLMSLYATSSMLGSSQLGSSQIRERSQSLRSQLSATATVRKSSSQSSSSSTMAKAIGGGGGAGTIGSTSMQASEQAALLTTSGTDKQFEGLCSNYLLNLNPNEHIICEFVENPRFTLKGNRERPIMMIGQDVGIVAFRAFWQQRAHEHDRAQVFYTLFKDLSPKKFGDMQLVCLTGNRCKIEDLFKREINVALTSRILSSASYIDRSHLIKMLDQATISSQLGLNTGHGSTGKLQIEAKELLDLGNRIKKLLIDMNGCLYTCCDSQMTQAIEILVVESIARHGQLNREQIMALLPKWKGRKMDEQPLTNNKFLFTLENPFERAQIVQEIYDSTI